MKKVRTLTLALLVGATHWATAQQLVAVNAPAPAPAASSVIRWQQTARELGNVPQGTPVRVTFTFTNAGAVPVRLTQVQGSCGCTATDYSQAPVAPGGSSVVTAIFNAAHAGTFSKTVNVLTSADPTPQVLTLRGTVVAQ